MNEERNQKKNAEQSISTIMIRALIISSPAGYVIVLSKDSKL